MKTPQSILVPTDLSEFSFIALKYAEEIAGLFQARVSLLTVVEHDGPAAKGDTREQDSLRERETRRILTELLLEKQIEHDHVSVIIRHGKPVAAIVGVARNIAADLIVMSTHGRTGLKHVLMGSVAEKVVRHAPCPVLTIKPEEFRELVALSEDDVAGSLHLHQST